MLGDRDLRIGFGRDGVIMIVFCLDLAIDDHVVYVELTSLLLP